MEWSASKVPMRRGWEKEKHGQLNNKIGWTRCCFTYYMIYHDDFIQFFPNHMDWLMINDWVGKWQHDKITNWLTPCPCYCGTRSFWTEVNGTDASGKGWGEPKLSLQVETRKPTFPQTNSNSSEQLMLFEDDLFLFKYALFSGCELRFYCC